MKENIMEIASTTTIAVVKAGFMMGASAILGDLTATVLGIVAPLMAVIVAAFVGSVVAIAVRQEPGIGANTLTLCIGIFIAMVGYQAVAYYLHFSEPAAAGALGYLGREVGVKAKQFVLDPTSVLGALFGKGAPK
jgi:hypothetical protein